VHSSKFGNPCSDASHHCSNRLEQHELRIRMRTSAFIAIIRCSSRIKTISVFWKNNKSLFWRDFFITHCTFSQVSNPFFRRTKQSKSSYEAKSSCHMLVIQFCSLNSVELCYYHHRYNKFTCYNEQSKAEFLVPSGDFTT
jgi:hypothetical protein